MSFQTMQHEIIFPQVASPFQEKRLLGELWPELPEWAGEGLGTEPPPSGPRDSGPLYRRPFRDIDPRKG